MSTLIGIAFDDAFKADALRLELLQLKKEYLVDLDDLVVVTKDEKGKIKLHQSLNLTASGAASGSFWGLLIGTLFFNPLLGAATGAAFGAFSGSVSDYGINDEFMRQSAQSIPLGGSALFALIRRSTEDKVLAKLKGFGGTVFKTSLSAEKEAILQAALKDPVVGESVQVQ